jgi:hypothetical protein
MDGLISDLQRQSRRLTLILIAILLTSCAGNSPMPLADSRLPSVPAATATFWPTWTRMPSTIITPRPTDTPVPGCTMPAPVVAIKVEPAKPKVGDTFAVSYASSPGFAMVAEVSLLMNSVSVAVLKPRATSPSQNLTVEPFPLARVMTGVMSGYTGEGTFMLRAIDPGTADVEVSIFGDTGFCTYTNGRCNCGTTFRTIQSNRVPVQVLSMP